MKKSGSFIPVVKKDGSGEANEVTNEFIVQQIGATNAAVDKLVQLQADQLQQQANEIRRQEALKPKPKPEVIKPPEDFDPNLIYDQSTPSGEFFTKVLDQRDKSLEDRIVAVLDKKVTDQNFDREVDDSFASVQKTEEIDDTRMQDFRKWVDSPSGVTMDIMYKVYDKINPILDEKGNPVPRLSEAAGGKNEQQHDEKGEFLEGLS